MLNNFEMKKTTNWLRTCDISKVPVNLYFGKPVINAKGEPDK